MKILMIGGTGTISAAIVRQLAAEGNELYILNRGNRQNVLPEGVHQIIADINDEEKVKSCISDLYFDAVCEFIGFVPGQVERDYRIFRGKTNQYIYISSASAYHKPVRHYPITEGTSLANPYWQYSRDKIACEELLMGLYRDDGFPVTIVRPSHTYDERSLPVAVHGAFGSWQVLQRMRSGKPVIVPGDGTSLWTVTFNTDFAAGYCGLVGNPHAIGEAFQITGDESLTWDQIHQTIADAIGAQYTPYHVSSYFLAEVGKQYDLRGGLIGDKAATVLFDNSKLKKAVPGFAPHIRFAQGARIAAQYILTHPEQCQRPDPDFDAWCDRVIEVQEQAKELF